MAKFVHVNGILIDLHCVSSINIQNYINGKKNIPHSIGFYMNKNAQHPFIETPSYSDVEKLKSDFENLINQLT